MLILECLAKVKTLPMLSYIRIETSFFHLYSFWIFFFFLRSLNYNKISKTGKDTTKTKKNKWKQTFYCSIHTWYCLNISTIPISVMTSHDDDDDAISHTHVNLCVFLGFSSYFLRYLLKWCISLPYSFESSELGGACVRVLNWCTQSDLQYDKNAIFFSWKECYFFQRNSFYLFS